MVTLGTPLSPHATRVLLLGSGELGKEVAIELQRLGVEVIAADRYADAPAMQVAHRSHVLDMLDPAAIRALIAREQPHLVVPEIEAIHTETLVALEAEGAARVIPTARAARLTMDREGIRRLAAETLGLPTSPYRFVDTQAEYREAVRAIGLPCVVKPVMSSSGKGQSTLRSESDIDPAWDYAQTGGRAGAGRCIVEGFIDFDYEITLLTVRHAGGISFCPPIGHRQERGDYRESWQPAAMSPAALAAAINETLEANGMQAASGVHIRLMVTRGIKRTPYQDPRACIGQAVVRLAELFEIVAHGPHLIVDAVDGVHVLAEGLAAGQGPHGPADVLARAARAGQLAVQAVMVVQVLDPVQRVAARLGRPQRVRISACGRTLRSQVNH